MLDANSFDSINQQSTVLKSIQSEAYGSGSLIQYKNNQLFHVIKTFDNFHHYEIARDQTKQRLSLIHPNLAQIYKYKTQENSTFCGSYYTIQTLVQYSPIIAPQGEKDYFQVIQNIVAALHFLNLNKIRHGMISPQTIIKGEQYQITDIRYFREIYEYQLQLIGFMDKCYLAPTLFEELGKRSQNPIYNYEKCEIFSLGIVILEAALNYSVQDIYNMDQFVVSADILEVHLRVLRDKYSNRFVDLVSKMLTIDEQTRLGFQDIIRIQTPQIQQMTPKIHNSLTPKIHNSTLYRSNSPISQAPSTPRKRIFANNFKSTQQQSQFQTAPLKRSEMNYFKSTKIPGQSPSKFQAQSPELDHKFNEFNDELENFKEKIKHLRVNTQSSVVQNDHISPYHSEENQFPTFKCQTQNQTQYPKQVALTQFPHSIDIGMNHNNNGDLRQLEQKIKDLKFDSYQYTTRSFYDDEKLDARLPQSGSIHMHSSGPAHLSDFFLKYKK